MLGLASGNAGQPGLRGRVREESGIERERVGLDGKDRPSVAERGPQLVLADPARAERPGLKVAEAHQVQVTAGPQYRSQAGDVPDPVVVVEHVEQAAVDNGVEAQA